MSKEKIYTLAALNPSELFELGEITDLSELPDNAVLQARLPIFRAGKFQHPVYGELDFTEDYLKRLVANYKTGVVPRAIAFDEDHKRFFGGAIAWIREDMANPLEVETMMVKTDLGERPVPVLFAHVEFNKRGISRIVRREYRYFSSEIHPNFSTNEVIPLSGHKDEEEESMAVIEYGPTLLGGGITNNPFIPGLGEFQFSEGVENYEGSAAVRFSDTVAGMTFCAALSDKEEEVSDGSFDEPEEEVNEPEEPVQNFHGEKTMFKELIVALSKIDNLEDQIAYLEESAQKFSADDAEVELVTALISSKRAELNTKLAFEDVVAESTRVKEENKRLQQDNIQLTKTAAEAKEIAYTKRVELFCAELEGEGHYQSVVNRVKDLLLNSPVETRRVELKFSTDEDAEKFDLMGVVKGILDVLPENARMDFSEGLNASLDVEVIEPQDGDAQAADAGETQVDPDKFSEPEVTVEDEGEQEIPDRIVKFAQKNEQPVESINRELWDAIDEDGNLQWKPVYTAE